MLATQLVGRLRAVFGVDLPMRALFEAPTIAGQAAHLEAALRGGALRAAPPLVAVPREGELPLSFAQQRLWFLDQLEPDSALYNVPAAVRLSGPLDPSALARSLSELARRHEALRTTFLTTDGRARQEIAVDPRSSLPVVDWYGRRRCAGGPRRRPGSRSIWPAGRCSGPRCCACRSGSTCCSWRCTTSSRMAGRWGCLVREIGALYEAFSAGRPSPLPALSIQYADYAVWQRQWLSGAVLSAQLAYWKKQLGTAPPALELPTDRPRPPVQTYRGAALPVALSRELSAGLGALSRREEVTLFMTLLAAFQLLLARYTGQKDIVVGSPIAGRTRVETEGLIGFFVNTLVLRTDLSGDPTVRELLGRVREVTLGAYAHQEVPFEKLVEELAPRRDLSRSPLFQVMLVLQNAPLPALSLGDLKLDVLEIEQTTAKFELTLSLGETEEGLRGSLKYSTDLFDAATVERMLGHYQVLLEGIVAEPSRRVSELPLLPAAERHQLVVEWNETKAEYPAESCIHALFGAQVEKTPEAVAVVFEEQRLTYRELNARANQLGHHLRGLGVGPDVLVGLCVERSVEMVVGLLGILKAGGAYVPLDPTYPRERLAFLLEDTGAPVLLTQERLLASLPEHRARVLVLDTGWAPIAREPVDDPAGGARPADLAYVIHTSGSTGKPKGVLSTHGGLCNRLSWMQAAFGLTGSDAVLQKTPYSFDVSVWEFFWPLLVGARLVVARPEGHKDSAYLAQILVAEEITTVHFVPSMLAVFLGEPGIERCVALKRVICSGEALPFDLTQAFFARSEAELWNLYGPTEASIDVTSWRCLGEDPRRVVPIGRPIANTQLYVLDRALLPVPIGVPGELYIGGVGVARGYLNRPDLTASVFLPDPFRGEPGARLYKTGDRCRFRPDGNLEYLGRADHQVKIRGFRIELGEIESVLGQHPAIREAVVLARQDAPGDKRLIAYLVAREAPLPGVGELRRYLQSKLPEYLMPAAFVEMPALPLTSSGKVDRRALPAFEGERLTQERAFVAPRTKLEEVLAERLRKLLEIERIGVFDDFFELGVDSIRAAIFINRLQQELGEIIHIVVMFQSPTLDGLATYLARRYAAAIARVWGFAVDAQDDPGARRRLTPEDIEALRRTIPPLHTGRHSARARNRPAVFVLSPPRSGSTLLRVMLGGHPRLFTPPELELLSFPSLQERKAAYADPRHAFSLEGTLRALMDLQACDAAEARRFMESCETSDMSTGDFYRVLQDLAGERLLVDKSPAYALQRPVLEQAEALFEAPRYIHLLRHPLDMIRSFVEARLDEVFFRHPHELLTDELAEALWVLSHQNIVDFLDPIPNARKHRVHFEELVREPEREMRAICKFLEVDFEPAMLRPYEDKKARMTDGLHEASRMLGDVKFHQHQRIDASVADRWKQAEPARVLGEMTWALAQTLGYPRRPVDLAADTLLDVSIAPVAMGHPVGVPQTPPDAMGNPAKAILLTGATGFLGAFLLRELLQRTDSEIFCLVRGTTDEERRERLAGVLASYGLWEDRFASRILAVPGDLSLPRFGLDGAAFDALAARVGVIYHNGAEVNFVYPYARLRGPNVLGTAEVLRLACRGERKPVHYVSTLSVFGADDAVDGDAFHERDEPPRAARLERLESGYAQSKGVAEWLALAARGRGVPVSIYRPSLVSGHSVTGACATGDFFNRFLKGCVQLGSAPELDALLNCVPVDYAAGAIVALSLRPGWLGRTFHLVNQHPTRPADVYEVVRSFGYPMSVVPYGAWRRQLLDATKGGSDNALAPLASLFGEQSPQSGERRFDDRVTREGLEGSGIRCPPPNRRLFETSIAYLIRCGFLR